jgi:hypothetical protein
MNQTYQYTTTTRHTRSGTNSIITVNHMTAETRIIQDLLTAYKYLCAETPPAQNLRGQTHQPPTSNHHRDDLLSPLQRISSVTEDQKIWNTNC